MRQAGATLHRGARAPHYRGLSRCGAQAPDAQAQQLWRTGSAAPRHVGSSQTRARTRVPCIGRQTPNHCATREAHENVSFLKQIVTGKEKWILYNNVEQKRSWGKRNKPPPTTPKAGLHPKKVMLHIWWDWKGVLYYELLLENQTINSNKYCSQLDQLKAALDGKRPELVYRKRIIFHQDNHVFL